MTLKEAAALLGVTPDTLRQQIAGGALKATKRGRDWHVEPWQAEMYRREHLRSPVEPWAGFSYPIIFSLRARDDGSVALSGTVNVRDGGGPFAMGDTVEEVVRRLRDAMANAEPWTDIEVPDGAEV